MILCDRSLRKLGPTLLDPFDPELVNPASIDIRVGVTISREFWDGRILRMDGVPQTVDPGEMVLVSTLETITVPNGYAVDLRLKSSRAREGWNHMLAFWFDPGWSGIGTMELQNVNRRKPLWIETGMKIAQIIVHQLDRPAKNPYNGRYQGAQTVERSKP